MAAWPWQAKPGIHQKLAWCAWLTIMAFFAIASLATFWTAVRQRARPVRVTFFDRKEQLYLPDVQICLLDGNRGEPEDVTTRVRSRFVETDEIWEDHRGFEYMTKADENLWDLSPNKTIPYFYSLPRDSNDLPRKSKLDYTSQEFAVVLSQASPDENQTGYLSPFGVLEGDNSNQGSISGVVIGAFPYTACMTFFVSLCPKQRQDILSRAGAPIVLSLNGTGPNFKYFGVSIGQHDYGAPLYADGLDIVYQKANLNSTLNLVVTPRYNKPILSLFQLLRIEKLPVFSWYSYSLGSVLPTSNQGQPSRPGNETINFTFTLEISLSSKGVEHVVAQEPLFGVFGTIGGLWTYVPLLFGLLYAATPSELQPTWAWEKAACLVPSRCRKVLGKAKEETDVGKAEGTPGPEKV
ncbi:hypothetical protein KFL_001170170 [Klebsormidium nitens]|uniref:Uncharacterized protein n=1 Tax=Klebsormidium nitens TaxID=105231 RepID=A0A1Y1HWS8_KLENI|nr:hypothetical protein KFL_001170170 [Klebsormidium nitens]|eukprot:GAQ82613.1 hypothetical protein KFL_001170170 [Klebsormidium nitens]